jgi:predicted ATPase/DNA-binding SARP family transcriptional activator
VPLAASAYFGILGTLEVRVAGRAVEVKGTQLRRLACILLLSAGRPVSLPSLCESMWPDESYADERGPKDPVATLRVYASRLRAVLPAHIGPHADPGAYRLEADRDDSDAGRFEALMVAASSSAADPGQAASTLRAALDLWRGPSLAEFRAEPWAIGAALRLDEMRLVAYERLNEARLVLGEHGDLCGELEHLVDEYPLRERLWAQLMLALYRAGRQGESLRAYTRLRVRLVGELGVEPSRELVELELAVLRQDRALDAPPPGERRGQLRHGERLEQALDRPAEGQGEPAGREGDHPHVAGGDRFGAGALPHNLPAQLTSFVGRRQEAADLQSLLRVSRLVTVVGAGGAGKTRLALHVAGDLLDLSGGGVWLVELAALHEGEEVEYAVARVLGIRPRGDSSVLESIVEALRDEHLLLLIDNCEHLLLAVSRLCEAILASCRAVSVLTTSREPLGIYGEVVYRVPSLALPGEDDTDPESIAGVDSIRLFVERARANQPSFVLDRANALVVSSLCRRLDGIPLALELSAARLRALSLQQIHDRLDQRFQLLVGGSPTRRPRQQTLASLLDWSYDLLSAREQTLVRRLGLFAGSFDLDAVVALSGDGADGPFAAIDGITSLVDKSLVLADTAGETARYRLLETIRQYGLAKLVEEEGPAVLTTLRDAHAAFYLDLAEKALPHIAMPDQFDWLARLDLEFDNIRQALDHLLAREGATRQAMRLLTAARRYFDWRGHEVEMLAATEALQGRPELSETDPLALWTVLIRSKALARTDPARAAIPLERALAAARELDHKVLISELTNRMAWIAFWTGELATAKRLHAESIEAARASGEYLQLLFALNGGGASESDEIEALELARAAGDAIGSYMVLSNLAAQAFDRGDPRTAHDYLEEALPIHQLIYPGGIDPNLACDMATALILDGEHESAKPLLRRALSVSSRHLDERTALYSIYALAVCAGREGSLTLAAALHGTADRHFRQAGFNLQSWERRLVAEHERELSAALGEAAFAAAKADGEKLTKQEAIELALGHPGLTLAVATPV